MKRIVELLRKLARIGRKPPESGFADPEYPILMMGAVVMPATIAYQVGGVVPAIAAGVIATAIAIVGGWLYVRHADTQEVPSPAP